MNNTRAFLMAAMAIFLCFFTITAHAQRPYGEVSGGMGLNFQQDLESAYFAERQAVMANWAIRDSLTGYSLAAGGWLNENLLLGGGVRVNTKDGTWNLMPGIMLMYDMPVEMFTFRASATAYPIALKDGLDQSGQFFLLPPSMLDLKVEIMLNIFRDILHLKGYVNPTFVGGKRARIFKKLPSHEHSLNVGLAAVVRLY